MKKVRITASIVISTLSRSKRQIILVKVGKANQLHVNSIIPGSGMGILGTTPKNWKVKIKCLLTDPWIEVSFQDVRQMLILENWNSRFIKILDEA